MFHPNPGSYEYADDPSCDFVMLYGNIPSTKVDFSTL